MAGLTRWDPFREMMSMRSMVDRMLEDSLLNPQDWQRETSWGLPLDVSENDDDYVVKASIPGVKPEDLDISFNNNTLTIKGETKSESEKAGEGTQWHMRERRFGSFSRTITLPSPVSSDQIEADYDAGVLTLRLPKAEEAKPKRISVQTGSQQPVLEGKFNNGKK